MVFSDEFQKISQLEAGNAAARFVYDQVHDWRGSEKKTTAAKRWLWELLQNARDCSKGKKFSFLVSWKPSTLTIRHNAGPFTMKEIVALVEGDSSKQRRSVDTTGKYGKGFLVTHLISTEVRVRGVLVDAERGKFKFTFQLSRGGPPGEILRNIRKCARALDDSSPFEDDVHETEFIYLVSPKGESRLCIDEALAGLQRHSPYLFAFIPELQELKCIIEGQTEACFAALTRTSIDARTVPAVAELISVATPLGARTIVILSPNNPDEHPKAQASGAIAFEVLGWPDRSKVHSPVTASVAKIFQDLPLQGTENLRIPVVVNLPRSCEVDSDRTGPDLDDAETRGYIEKAFGGLPFVIDWAVGNNMSAVHRLAEFGISDDDAKNPVKARDWAEIIEPVLRRIVACKLVQTSRGTLVRPEDAVFPRSTWLESDARDPELLRGTRDLLQLRGDNVPTPDSILEWDEILSSWRDFQNVTRPRLVGLKDLFASMQASGGLANLRAKHTGWRSDVEALKYVCEVFRVAAEYCRRHSIIAPEALTTAAIIPNQLGLFRGPDTLWLDGGVDEILKEVSNDLGMPFKERLVHVELAAEAVVNKLIRELCGNRIMKSGGAVSELMNTIEVRASDAEHGKARESTKRAAVKLLIWLAGHEGSTNHDLKPFPLLCRDGKLRPFASLHEVFLAPMPFISEDERRWAQLVPDYIRLADDYVDQCDKMGISPTVFGQFLQTRQLVSSSLIFERQTDFDSELVAALQGSVAAPPGHRIEKLTVKDVAGLTRLLSDTAGMASGGPSQAQLVLDFVLRWLVVHDVSWKTPVAFACSSKQAHSCVGEVAVYPCLWLGKLKTMRWIPAATIGEPCEALNARTTKWLLEKMPADAVQSVEARRFLALHCGVDGLELAIRAQAGGDAMRESQLRDQWAAVVDTVQPSDVLEFVNRRRAASEINTRNNTLGHVVEKLVQAAFDDEGFDTHWTGVGSDFAATLANGADPDWDREDVGMLTFCPAYRGKPLTFLVEVKSTRDDLVRMSWIQGNTAAKHGYNYILCVVDFKGQEEMFERVLSDDEPTAGLIADGIRVVPGIGKQLAGAVRSLSYAVTNQTPGIEVEKADEIRFRILRQLWLDGEGLSTWARSVKRTFELEDPPS